MSDKEIKVFISYSWDDDEHKEWVRRLADSLESDNDFHVIWDGYDLDNFSDKNEYMENAVFNSDYVVVVGTKKYKDKADNRKGGAGIETYLNSIVHWQGLEENKKSKLILVLKESGGEPNYLKGHISIRFLDDNKYTSNVLELKKALRKESLIKRPEKKRNN